MREKLAASSWLAQKCTCRKSGCPTPHITQLADRGESRGTGRVLCVPSGLGWSGMCLLAQTRHHQLQGGDGIMLRDGRKFLS